MPNPPFVRSRPARRAGLILLLAAAGLGVAYLYRDRFRGPLDRPAFETAVGGQPPEVVRERVGPPDEVADGPGGPVWVYRRRVTDPATGRPFDEARVGFTGGKARRLDFR